MTEVEPKCFLSFDVEDWFHVENLSSEIDRSRWDDKELRVDDSTLWLLDLLDEYDTQATFFVLGWVAEKLPSLVKEIDSRGHEVASHGYNHKLIYEMEKEEFREDLRHSQKVLEGLIGENPSGYRAPNFSITDTAIEILQELGFNYDSSYFPSLMHDRYGELEDVRDSCRSFSNVSEGFVEFPISVNDVAGCALPWGGGGYFRLIPYQIFRWGIKSILDRQNWYMFYLHSWELDSDQPEVSGIPWTYKFRHYYGLDSARTKLERLLDDFDFSPIRNHSNP